MSLVSFTPLQDGSTGVNAAATNTPLSTIYNDYNGNITDANIAANAAIAGSKINMVSLSNPYKFYAYLNSTTTTSSSAIGFQAVLFDTSSNFTTGANAKFTAPVAGFYQFNAAASITVGLNQGVNLGFTKNGTSIAPGTMFVATYGTSNTAVMTGSALLQLAAGDYVQVTSGYTNGLTILAGAAATCFSGFLVSAT